MALRPERKYASVREQDASLDAFYQDFDQDDEDFLGNRFIGEDKDDFNPEGSDSDGGNDEPAVVEEPETEESEMKNDKENMLTKEMILSVPKLQLRFHKNKIQNS